MEIKKSVNRQQSVCTTGTTISTSTPGYKLARSIVLSLARVPRILEQCVEEHAEPRGTPSTVLLL
jgi:hypothetical protein